MTPMLTQQKNRIESKKTYIWIFIQKTLPKNMQDLNVFLQKNNFLLKRITKNFQKKNLIWNLTNSNFLIESHCDIDRKQLQNVVSFLKKSTNINGIFFQNQVLNLDRISHLPEQTPLNLWKQISTFRL